MHVVEQGFYNPSILLAQISDYTRKNDGKLEIKATSLWRIVYHNPLIEYKTKVRGHNNWTKMKGENRIIFVSSMTLV